MKIVFLDPSGELGGAETALVDMLAALRRARPDWALSVVTGAPGPLLTRIAPLNIPSLALSFPQSLARAGEWGTRGSVLGRTRLAMHLAAAVGPVTAYGLELRRHLRDAHPDVVHTNGLKMHLLGAQARPPAAKVVWHLHDYPDARVISGSLLQKAGSRCSAIVANSASVAASATSLFDGHPPVHTVHNAIDLERFTPVGGVLDLDRAAGMPPAAEGVVRVGLVGTYARWKGHDVFLRALARLAPEPPVRGYIIGGPIYRTAGSQFSLPELRARASAVGLEGKVGFTGFIDDVPAALRSLDIVVHASVEPEPFGLVAAEAMACGRALVAARAGGVVEVADGASVFHQPGNADDLAVQIATLAADADRRSRLGGAARGLAEDRFSRERMAAALIHVYESLT